MTSFSHTPQLELTVSARSWLAIVVYSSSSVWPVLSFGALYTITWESLATASVFSMSATTSMSPA